MKCFTIIAGINGVGKSSLTGVLSSQTTGLGQIIDVDRMAAQEGGYVAGGRKAVESINACLEKGISFTEETTLAGLHIVRTAQMAKNHGYFVRLYYIGLDSAEECLKRISNRVAKGGHDIPAEDVMRRYAGRASALGRILPYCDEGIFFDNNNGFEEVAEYKNGRILLKGNNPPAWIKEFAGARL